MRRSQKVEVDLESKIMAFTEVVVGFEEDEEEEKEESDEIDAELEFQLDSRGLQDPKMNHGLRAGRLKGREGHCSQPETVCIYDHVF